MLPRTLTAVVTFTLLAPVAAQQVELAGGTGRIAPGQEWTVLRQAELAAATRPTDPTGALPRAMLQGVVDELRTRARTADHVLLHAAGPADQLRMINCYHGDGSTTGAELRDPKAIEALRRAVEPNVATGGATATFGGHSHPDLWPTGSLSLRFDVQMQDQRWTLDYHVVPAGSSLQFFEVLHFPDDPAAVPAIEAVLRSFDGARDGRRSSLVTSALTGALIGGLLGVSAWSARRRTAQAANARDDAHPAAR